MRLDDRNEPQPGEAARPEAPVVYVWPYWPFHCYKAPGERIRRHPATATVTIRDLRAMYPGHTIDLSAEPPEGISR